MFITYTISPYDQRINEVIMQKQEITNEIKSLGEEKDGSIIKKIQAINDIQKRINKEQKETIEQTRKLLDGNLIAYGYICNKLSKKIGKTDNIININTFFSGDVQNNIMLKKKLEKVINGYNVFTKEYISFYKESCNQDNWFKKIINKFFIK